MKLQRTWYIPNGCYKVADKHSIALVYWRKTGKQCTPYEAVAFHGQAPYPDWHYLFQSREKMEQRISGHFVSVRAYAKSGPLLYSAAIPYEPREATKGFNGRCTERGK